LVPYVGVGLDILVSDYKRDFDGRNLDVDTTVGAHVTGGVDYFLKDQLALTAEIKTLLAPNTDIYDSGHRVGDFDPSSFSSTFGVRYFFN
jgi:outer membrane protein